VLAILTSEPELGEDLMQVFRRLADGVELQAILKGLQVDAHGHLGPIDVSGSYVRYELAVLVKRALGGAWSFILTDDE